MNTREHFDFLVGLLSARMPIKRDAISSDDWNAVVDLSFAHGVGTILLKRLAEVGQPDIIPAASRQKLTAQKICIAIENTQLYVELAAVLNSLNGTNVPVVVLKGAHLAELVYETIALRPMDDIDLLVKEGDLNTVVETLSSLGYVQLDSDAQRMKSNDPHHLTPFRKEGCKPIEVHWKVPSIDAEWIEEAWAKTRTVEVACVRARVLAPEDLLLHLSVHASLHHRFGVGLRPLCDIAATVERHAGEIDWAKLRASALRCRARNVVYLTLRLAREMAGAPIPDDAMQILRPNSFDEATLTWAREQILTRSKELFDSSAVSPRLANFWNAPFTEQCKQLFHAAFPPRAQLDRGQHRSGKKHSLFRAYLQHWNGLLTSRSVLLWRLLVRDSVVLAKADMYTKLLDGSD